MMKPVFGARVRRIDEVKMNRIPIQALAVFILTICSVELYGQCGLPGTPPCSRPKATTSKPKSPPRKPGRSSTPKLDGGGNPLRTLFPALAEVQVPGYSGILVESMDGGVVVESNASLLFNPASNVKIATAYAVLKTFGPEFRFITNIYTDGVIDRRTGTLIGNLYLSGKDPMFGFQHGVTLANELNKMGINSVAGDLIVSDNFAMNYSASAQLSARTLKSTLDASTRTPAANQAWLNHRAYAGKLADFRGVPSVPFSGASRVEPIQSNLTHLFSHESAPLRDALTLMLLYPNNVLSERLGDLVGGPYAVSRLVHVNAGVRDEEFTLATSSGLGSNLVTPNAMMKLLRAFRSDLAQYGMTLADLMGVAGISPGLLDTQLTTGTVIAHAASDSRVGGGVRALVGEMNTRSGRLLFVIVNQRGSVSRFRTFQDYFVSLVQGQFGGAVPVALSAAPLDSRLARTRISYPYRTSKRVDCSKPIVLTAAEDYGYDTVKPRGLSSLVPDNDLFLGDTADTVKMAKVLGNAKFVLLSREIQTIRVDGISIKSYKVLVLNPKQSVRAEPPGEWNEGGEIGYVSCSDFTVYFTERSAGDTPFVRERVGDPLRPPLIRVKNDSAETLSLIIAENRYVIFPSSWEEITLPAGRYKFVATAPGVIPLVGTETWDAGSRYTWTFYTERIIK